LVEQHISFKISDQAAPRGISLSESLNFVIVKRLVSKKTGRVDGLGPAFFPYIVAEGELQTYAHEAGHALSLSTVEGKHDPGPDPLGNIPIMGVRIQKKTRGHWLLQEDWRAANIYAGANLK
jgi:hypothetical protein